VPTVIANDIRIEYETFGADSHSPLRVAMGLGTPLARRGEIQPGFVAAISALTKRTDGALRS
jgi:hypothetical protein